MAAAHAPAYSLGAYKADGSYKYVTLANPPQWHDGTARQAGGVAPRVAYEAEQRPGRL